MKHHTVRRALAVTAVLAMGISGLAACGSSTSNTEAKGKVYYLKFKPEVAEQWQSIAETYTQETGVPVTVQTAASGTYDQTLKSELAKAEKPTLFQVSGPVGLDMWKDYVTDMSDTAVYKHMNDQSTALEKDGKPVAIPFVNESIGIIYNKDILNRYCELSGAKIDSVDDIKSFDTLKEVADDIQAHKDDLGIRGAFTSSGMDSSSYWRFSQQLAAVPLYYEFKDKDTVQEQPASIDGTYLPNFKNIWDLYITDSTTEASQIGSTTLDDASSEFALGEAAFYQNGTWAWTDLNENGMDADNVGMLPIYIGVDGEEDQGLITGTMNYWCITTDLSDDDRKATEDFLEWMITSDEGKDALSKDMGFTVPFDTFDDVETDNPLVAIALKDEASDSEKIPWVHTMEPSDAWQKNLASAMLEYAQGTGTWDQVKQRFVDDWAVEVEASKS